MVTYKCPKCKSVLESPESMRGQYDTCPVCKLKVLVQAESRRRSSATRWFAIAAVPALAMLGIGGYFLLKPPPVDTATVAQHPRGSSDTATPSRQPADGKPTPTSAAPSAIAQAPHTPSVQAPPQQPATPGTPAPISSPPPAPKSAPETTKLAPYKDALRDLFVSTRQSLWTYCITVETAELQLTVERTVDPKTQKSIDENKPRFTEETVAEFQKWLAGKMTGPKKEPLPEANLIRQNAQHITKLISDISYRRREDTSPGYTPSSGFTSGNVVRIGAKNDSETALLVGQLGTGTVYNTLRSTEKGRAGTILKERIFTCLRAVHACGKATGAKHVGVVYAYGSRDFSEKYGSTDVEVLGFIASLEDCRRFLEQDISQEEFLRRSEIFLFDTSGNMKRIELALE